MFAVVSSHLKRSVRWSTRVITDNQKLLSYSAARLQNWNVKTTVEEDEFISNGDQMRPRLLQLKSKEKAKPIFSSAEMDGRLTKLRQFMEQERLNAVLFTSMHNVVYYSGFLYCAFGRPYGLVVTPESSTTITAGIDCTQPWRRSHDANIIYTDWQQDNFYKVIQKLLIQNQSGVLGCEFDHMTLDVYRNLNTALPNLSKVDVGTPVMYTRLVKSQEEQEVIREGARISEIGAAAVIDAMEENAPEHVIADSATRAMVMEIADTYPQSEIRDSWTWFQSGLNTDGAHNPVTTRRVQPGDICSLNCFPMIQGYYIALERTLFLDHASDEHIRIWQVNLEVFNRGLELIRPGARCCDIAIELNDIYARYGLLEYRSFGYGHSFGVLSHYYGREAALELREDIETKLEPGMIISMEPMVTIPEGRPGAGGYREHNILIVTEDGAEDINNFPYGPENMIIKK